MAVVLFTSCGSDQQRSGESEAIQTEIFQLENASEEIEASATDLDTAMAGLDAALDSLDILFPEEDNN